MKMVIGEFIDYHCDEFAREYCEEKGIKYTEWTNLRHDQEFIDYIIGDEMCVDYEIEHGIKVSYHPSEYFTVVDIPDEATDYGIYSGGDEWHGYEHVVYVVDGKLHDIFGWHLK